VAPPQEQNNTKRRFYLKRLFIIIKKYLATNTHFVRSSPHLQKKHADRAFLYDWSR
jgi:hypothetical protein